MSICLGKGIGVPFRMGGGQSWQTYWATLISAVVEDAAPNDFVLTFATGKPTLDETDFTIAGFPLTGAVWVGAVLTLTSSTAVVYGDAPVITFVPSGGTANVTNNVAATAELTTYITGLTTPLSLSTRRVINEFIKTRKTKLSVTNLSDVYDYMYLLLGETEESSLKNLVKDDHHCTKVGSPVHTPYYGIQGDGSTMALDTNYNESTEAVMSSQNNSSFGFYSQGNAKSGVDIGLTGVAPGYTPQTILWGRDNSDKCYIRLHNAPTGTLSGDCTDGSGMFIATRDGADMNHLYGYRNKVAFTTRAGTVNTSALVNANDYILCFNVAGSGASTHSIRPLAFVFKGRHHTQTEADDLTDDVTDLISSISGVRSYSNSYTAGLSGQESSVVLLTFDDGTDTQNTLAYPELEKRGMVGTLYMISNNIDTAGNMTTAQLQNLYSKKWDIGNHTATHPHVNGLTQAQVEAELEECEDDLIAIGLTRATKHIAYPYGEADSDVIAAVTSFGGKTGRGGGDTVSLITYADANYPLKISWANLSDLAWAKGVVDAAITQNKTAIFTFHTFSVGGSVTATNWPISVLQDFLDYLLLKGIKTMTIDEFYRAETENVTTEHL